MRDYQYIPKYARRVYLSCATIDYQYVPSGAMRDYQYIPKYARRVY